MLRGLGVEIGCSNIWSLTRSRESAGRYPESIGTKTFPAVPESLSPVYSALRLVTMA
jgi:hypothetical protein